MVIGPLERFFWSQKSESIWGFWFSHFTKTNIQRNIKSDLLHDFHVSRSCSAASAALQLVAANKSSLTQRIIVTACEGWRTLICVALKKQRLMLQLCSAFHFLAAYYLERLPPPPSLLSSAWCPSKTILFTNFHPILFSLIFFLPFFLSSLITPFILPEAVLAF